MMVLCLEPVYLIDANIPTEDVDAVLNSVTEAVSLAYGRYDQVAFMSSPYEEPVVNVRDGWASRARGKGDEDNPHRWWNRKKRQGS